MLGPVQALDGDRDLDLGGPMNRALVARLALSAGHPVAPATLIADLWDADLPADATNALQSIVSRTRRRLPDGALVSTPAGYLLHAEVDAARFHRLVADGRPDEALALWRGDALADVREAPFAARLGPTLDEARLAAREQDLARRRPDAAVVAELAELTRAHPYRDGLWLLLLQALVASGRPAEALAAYETLRARLAEDLGTDPSPELRRYHTRILRGEVGASSRRGTLPVALTSFVGRDTAVADLRAALAAHRLVTVLGPGGAGKTRLAIETARACQDRLPQVWLVELATVTGDDDVLPAVLSGMGLLEVSVLDRSTTAPADRRARALDAVADAEGLLVLDNCEHLIDAAADVAEQVLARAPRLRVLATSREALQLIGEWAYPLGPLSVPPAGADVAEAAGSSAVRLFTERARAVDRSFTLDAATLPAVREICARLDGQPLAIELAAARLRTLSVADVAARLSDRFRLLTGGSRTLPRHRTLRAVVEWSWDLLSDDERDLAERISVFPSGVTPEGAAAVFDGAGGTADLLAALAEKSLLVPVRQSGRFRMLETLREFGAERLVERGIIEKVRSAHLDHCLALAESLAEHMGDTRQVEAIRTVHTERGNLTAALRYAADRGDRERAARLLQAMLFYLAIRNEHAELNGMVDLVLPLPGFAGAEAEMTCAAIGIVRLMISETPGDWRPLAERILAVWDEHHPTGSWACLVMAGLAHFGLTGDRELPEPPDVFTRSMIGMLRLGMLENAGRTSGTEALLAETIEGFRACGDSWGLSAALSLQGALEAYDGRFDAALAHWQEALPRLEALGAEQDAAFCRLRLQTIQILVAAPERLVEMRAELTDDLRAAIARDARQDRAFALLELAQVERALGDHRAATEHLTRLVGTLEGLDPFGGMQFEVTCRCLLAITLVNLGDAAAARAELAVALDAAVLSQDMPVLAFGLGASAALAHRLDGDAARAARLLGAAEAVRGRPDRSNVDAETLARELGEHLGAEAYRALFAEGDALREQALDLARASTTRPA